MNLINLDSYFEIIIIILPMCYRRLPDIEKSLQRLQCTINVFPPSQTTNDLADTAIIFLTTTNISVLFDQESFVISGNMIVLHLFNFQNSSLIYLFFRHWIL